MSASNSIRKERIHAAANTVIPSLMCIITDGYLVWREFHNDPEPTSPLYPGVEEYHAENAEFHFSAYDPLELLGLIAMRKMRGVDWKPTDEEFEVYERLQASSRNFDRDGKLIPDE